MRRVLPGVLSGSAAVVLVLALRILWAPAPEPTAVAPRFKVRMPLVRSCPPAGAEARALLQSVEVETRLRQAELEALLDKRKLLGPELRPDDVPAELRPEFVAGVVQDLLPEGAEVIWGCETVPCSGVVVLDGAGEDVAAQARAFADALDAEYPEGVLGTWFLGETGYGTDQADATVTAVSFQVDAGLSDEHDARMYWLSRHNRKQPVERLRQSLVSDEP